MATPDGQVSEPRFTSLRGVSFITASSFPRRRPTCHFNARPAASLSDQTLAPRSTRIPPFSGPAPWSRKSGSLFRRAPQTSTPIASSLYLPARRRCFCPSSSVTYTKAGRNRHTCRCALNVQLSNNRPSATRFWQFGSHPAPRAV